MMNFDFRIEFPLDFPKNIAVSGLTVLNCLHIASAWYATMDLRINKEFLFQFLCLHMYKDDTNSARILTDCT